MTVAVTWLVWSLRPPEMLEKICCASMLDAARAWADRQFRSGRQAHNGMEVLVRAEDDAMPNQSTYRVKIHLVNAPTFRATLAGLAFEGVNGDPRG